MKKILSAFCFGCFILISLNATASLVRVQSETFFSQRTGDDKKSEMPFYEQFSMSYLTDSQRESLDVNFSYAYDFQRKTYDFDLHQFSGQFESADKRIKIAVGRRFQSYRLIHSSIVDSLSGSYLFPEKRLEVGLLVGKARQFEFNQDEREANIASLFADYKTTEVFPWKWGGRLENRDFSNLNRGSSTWGKLSLKKEWPVTLHPEITLLTESNLDSYLSYRREAGVNFYPSIYTTYGLSVQEYRMSAYESWEDPISSIFSRGEIREATLTLGRSLGPKWYLGGAFSLSAYEVEPGQETTGGKIEVLGRWQEYGHFAEFNIFRFSSIGGWAQGEKLRWIRPVSDRLEVELNQEYVQYEKLTSAKSAASSTQLGLAVWMWKQCRLWVAGEYNVNNFYSQDISLLSRLTVYEWREM